MVTKHYSSFFLLLTMFLVTSCEKELQKHIPYGGDKLVLYGELSASEPVRIFLLKTSDPNGTIKDDLISDALVTVFENGTSFDTLVVSKNNLFISKSGKIPGYGNRYKIKVESKAFGYIETAEIKAALPAKGFSADIVDHMPSGLNPGKMANEVRFKVIDDRHPQNYYYVSIDAFFNGGSKNHTKYPLSKNVEVKDNCGFFTNDNSYVFSNTCFTGDEYVLSYAVEEDVFDISDFKYKKPDSLVVTLRKIDKLYYDFLEVSREVFFLENAFNKPVLAKTNIINGYGIWTATDIRRNAIPLK